MQRWKACRWARSYWPGSRRRSKSISRDADSAASARASSAASVMPSRLRSTPLAGSRYGSPAALLTCGRGTGPAPAAHRWTAARPPPRRTAPGPPHWVPAPRLAPRLAPPRPRAAAPRPPAALRTVLPTQAPPPPSGERRRRPRRPGLAGPGPARPRARRGTRGTTRPPALPPLKRTPLRTRARWHSVPAQWPTCTKYPPICTSRGLSSGESSVVHNRRSGCCRPTGRAIRTRSGLAPVTASGSCVPVRGLPRCRRGPRAAPAAGRAAGEDRCLMSVIVTRYITQVMNQGTTEGTGLLREMAGLDEGAPLFVQVAERLADEIADGGLGEGERVPSTNELAAYYRSDPATAAKGIGMLTDDGLVEKRRGIGMFVADGARQRLLAERRKRFAERYVGPLVAEAGRLGIGADELAAMIRESSYAQEGTRI